MVDFKQLDPDNVRFSQATIKNVYEAYPNCLVKDWRNELPYTCPIRVTDLGRGPLTYDNRRLYSARHRKSNDNPQHTVECAMYDANDSLDTPGADETGEARGTKIYLAWKGVLSSAGRKLEGIYVLRCSPNTIGGAVALRCAKQGSSFPLHGIEDRPTFGR